MEPSDLQQQPLPAEKLAVNTQGLESEKPSLDIAPSQFGTKLSDLEKLGISWD